MKSRTSTASKLSKRSSNTSSKVRQSTTRNSIYLTASSKKNTVIQNKKTHEQIGLGVKINKKIQDLNLNTGKPKKKVIKANINAKAKQQIKKSSQTKILQQKEKSEEEIEEQLQQYDDYQYEQGIKTMMESETKRGPQAELNTKPKLSAPSVIISPVKKEKSLASLTPVQQQHTLMEQLLDETQIEEECENVNNQSIVPASVPEQSIAAENYSQLKVNKKTQKPQNLKQQNQQKSQSPVRLDKTQNIAKYKPIEDGTTEKEKREQQISRSYIKNKEGFGEMMGKIYSLSPSKLKKLDAIITEMQQSHDQNLEEEGALSAAFDQKQKQKKQALVKDYDSCSSNAKAPLPSTVFMMQDSRIKKSNNQKREKATTLASRLQRSSSRSRIKLDSDEDPNSDQSRIAQNRKSSEQQFNRQKTALDCQKQNCITKDQQENEMTVISGQKNKQLILSQFPIKNVTDISVAQKIIEPNKNSKNQHFNNNDAKRNPFSKGTTNTNINSNIVTNAKQADNEQVLMNQSVGVPASASSESKIKLLKLKKAKAQPESTTLTTEFKFEVISNHGHTDLFGLSAIEMYGLNGERVDVNKECLLANTCNMANLIKLFNKSTNQKSQIEQLVQLPLKKSQIIVKVDSGVRVGGIRIFNLNKSALDADKQVDKMKIYHNGSPIWVGSIIKGSYDNNIDNSTRIQIAPNFQFPLLHAFQKIQGDPQTKIQSSKSIVASKQSEIKKSKQFFSQQQHAQRKIKASTVEPKRSIKIIQQNMIQLTPDSVSKLIESSVTKDNKVDLEPLTLTQQNTKKQQKSQTFNLKQGNISTKRMDQRTVKVDSGSNMVKASQESFKQSDKANFTKNDNSLNMYDSFDFMLHNMEKQVTRKKSESKMSKNSANIQQPKPQSFVNKDKSKASQSRNTNNVSSTKTKKQQKRSLEDFMNDSLFQDKPSRDSQTIKGPQKQEPLSRVSYQKNQKTFDKAELKQNANSFKSPNEKDLLLSDLLKTLDKDIKCTKGQISKGQCQVPFHPQGIKVSLMIQENWGHPAMAGLRAVEFYNTKGIKVYPSRIWCIQNGYDRDVSQILKTSDFSDITEKGIFQAEDKKQLKIGFTKQQSTTLNFQFRSKTAFSMIRLWNYQGGRINSNIAVKNCTVQIDEKNCFMGSLLKQTFRNGKPRPALSILFTNQSNVIENIKKADWLMELKRHDKLQKQKLKDTLQKFSRPITGNSQNQIQQFSKLPVQKKENPQIKLPKRSCWQYEPPILPQGVTLTFILHQTWGDTNFIGLNGIEVFDDLGNLIPKSSYKAVKALPSSAGLQGDSRIVQNLLNKDNSSSNDKSIWLSTFQSDLDKVDSGYANLVLLQLQKSTCISGINVFNYSKNPERGVQELEIRFNNFILFRGYLRQSDVSGQNNQTSINFTRDLELLQKMSYLGYNEDNKGQSVQLINEKKKMR